MPSEQALGIFINMEEDIFVFRVQTLLSGPVTRRTVLSITSSLFDPVGFVIPFVLKVKIILQELCR